MNSMSKQPARVTDVFKQSRSDAARGPPTRSHKAATAAAPPPTAAAAAAAHDDDQDAADEAVLRQFDLDNRFGPCCGASRLERWERAARLGLEPPAVVKALVEKHGVASLFNKDAFCEEKPF